VQKEVGERLAAKVGDDAYGAVSVKIAYWTEASLAGLVPPSVFLPQPNVDSALVRLDRRVEPAVSGIDPEDLFYLVRAGFSQRRKMLRRVLSDVVSAEMFEEAAVDPQARAEALDVADWGRLAKVWVAKRTSVPPSPSVTGGKGKSR
jgi:16S rRNA (adenine1518-N6/adenine1519-N6)-dimethyltransferase